MDEDRVEKGVVYIAWMHMNAESCVQLDTRGCVE